MEPLYYVIAILGCGDSGIDCQQARVEPVRYTTATQCQAALPIVLPRHADLSFPVIQAVCRQLGEFYAQNGAPPRG
ncbi:hypothetical protein [Sphingomonas sp.]|uniref:hypothetical protein n=1 Tax=Sphingomonas sp. TaxID=28214 RepID=UPI002DD637A0|nr:hypothetical protein [Sphingomonas sp.]